MADPQIEPSLDAVNALAGDYDVVPLRSQFVDDCETPVSAFLKLRAGLEGPAFLLESAAQGQHVGRYSFIGVSPRDVVRWSLGDDGDPYEIARQAAELRQAPFAGAPPFTGGAVGFFAYDLVRTVETTLGPPNEDVLGLPDLALMVSDVLVVFDHLKHTVTILANASTGDLENSYAEVSGLIARIKGLLDGPLPRPTAPVERAEPEFVPNMEREQFEAMVARIIEYVYAGDAFQVVPSQRWTARLDRLDSFSVYRGLRAVNPSPYMYFLDFGDFEIVGASPEPLLTVHDGHASMRPIAGTRPRGADPQEMLEDEKERAEHIMLVDLARNDLGRVCDYASVSVDELMIVEQYSTVMHLVSSVSGQLRDGLTPLDALRAILPAGTLSGAPKVRAMEIIDELEQVKRGGYGGAVGYVGYSGDLDTCIHIRTVVIKDGVAHIQAGGGTVADAKPDYEYEESCNKAMAVKQAIQFASAQEDWF